MTALLLQREAARVLNQTDQACEKSQEMLARLQHSSEAYGRQMENSRHAICAALREMQRHKAAGGGGRPGGPGGE